MLAHHAGDNTHRHVFDHGHKHGFKQQRETRPGPRPGNLDLQHAAIGAKAARHAAVQKRLVLEKIQMPPCLLGAVMDRTPALAAA
jgi:hypothetical protein